MGKAERPLRIIIGETSVWRGKYFTRWWDMANAVGCAIFAWCATMLVFFAAKSFYDSYGLHESSSLYAWAVFVSTGAFYIAAYLFMRVPVHITTERELVKQRLQRSVSGIDDPYMQEAKHTRSHREIAEKFLLPSGRGSEGIAKAVHEYDAMLDKSGLIEHRASLIIEEGRCRRRWISQDQPTLEVLVSRAYSEAITGEVEPVTLPIRLRFLGIMMPICVALTVGGTSTMEILRMVKGSPINAGTRDFAVDMFGIGLASMLIVGYLGLREQGLFPLALWRGECSAEKTRVFHGFRWKTFRPGRDLAILRFTSNQEADIAFLGADGSHATARVGGKYLNHFIACWASPVKHAECGAGAEAEARGGGDEG